MKVTLDLTGLLNEGAITAEEHDRLSRLGQQDTGLVLVNVLVGFGVIAVAIGTLALVPSAFSGTAIGAILMLAGISLSIAAPSRWAVLSSIFILIAAFLLATGFVLLSQGMTNFDDIGSTHHSMPLGLAFVLVAVLFGGCAALARSGLLASLSVVMLFAALGGNSYYGAATYGLQVTEPFATVLLFGVLALAADHVSRRAALPWQRLGIFVARTALFLANLGFWVGSWWGDRLDWLGQGPHAAISAYVFAVTWAVLLIGFGVWAGLTDRRWALNLAVAFGGIHFYTQWFDWAGATPASLLLAGLVLLICAIALWRLNRGSAASLVHGANSSQIGR